MKKILSNNNNNNNNNSNNNDNNVNQDLEQHKTDKTQNIKSKRMTLDQQPNSKGLERTICVQDDKF